jgi:hypothetical protein
MEILLSQSKWISHNIYRNSRNLCLSDPEKNDSFFQVPLNRMFEEKNDNSARCPKQDRKLEQRVLFKGTVKAGEYCHLKK